MAANNGWIISQVQLRGQQVDGRGCCCHQDPCIGKQHCHDLLCLQNSPMAVTLEAKMILVATNLAMKEMSKVQGETQGSISSCSSTGSRMEDGVAISSSTDSPVQ
jgi:hypothetical protein